MIPFDTSKSFHGNLVASQSVHQLCRWHLWGLGKILKAKYKQLLKIPAPAFLLTMLLLVLNAPRLIAQNNPVDIISPAPSALSTYVRSNNLAKLDEDSKVSISYDDIAGSPYWDNNWNSGLLLCTQNVSFFLQQAKVNLYTGDVHYMAADGKEMVATNIVKGIILYKGKDTTKQTAVFEKFAFSDADISNAFYQVFNQGDIRLLRLIKIDMDEDMDVIAAKKNYKFVRKSNYYLAVNEVAKYLKRLNQESIFEYITSTPAITDWLKQNKNTLKNEAQIVSFLNFYNSSKH